jgi:ABC-type phosphate transport system auxiliary subunit
MPCFHTQEERLLIDAHLNEQSTKQSELESREGDVKGRVSLLESTLSGLSLEMDKLSLLVEGVNVADNDPYSPY